MAEADDILAGYLGSSAPVSEGTGNSKDMSADDILKLYTTDNSKSSSGRPRVIIDTTPKPPISGATAEQSADINAQPSKTGNENPRRYSNPANIGSDIISGISELPGDIVKSAGEAARGGIDTIKSGASDVLDNKPASGIGKIGMGTLQYATSPLSGVTKELVEKPVTNLTGNEDIGERAGQIASFALPVAPASKAANAARPVNRALNDFIDAIGGKDRIPEFLAEYKSNPRLAAMDVSPSLLQTTQKLAVTPGPHQNLLSDVVNKRISSAKGAVTDAYDSTMGAPVNVLDKINSMKAAAKSVGSKEIQPALKNATPVDVTPVIKHIDDILKPGINSVVSNRTDLATTKVKEVLASARQYLTDDKSHRTSAQELHTIQSSLGNTAYKLSKSPNPEDRLIAGALTQVKEKIVDAVDKATNGAYRPARAKFADERHIDDGFAKGTEILKNGSNFENRPEYWQNWKDNAKPAVIEAAKEGARIAVDQQIRGMRFAAKKGTDIPEIEFNKDKLSILFGKAEVEKMATKLRHEKAIAETNTKLFQGSQTAMRASADSRIAQKTTAGLEGSSLLPYVAEGVAAYATGLPGVGASAYKAADLAKKHIVNPITNRLADAKNLELTRLASATGREKQDLINKLSRISAPNPKPSIVNRAKLLISP